MPDLYENCRLCARLCGINRYKQLGYCKMPNELYVARAALHMWEEPCISGIRGSGAIFFSGCSLKCSFCQNSEISRGINGKKITKERLVKIMLELFNKGAHNINLVTATHYAPTVIEAVSEAKRQGLNIPILYNTSSYDTVDTIRSLAGTVDIYLPDFKYYTSSTSALLCAAPDYPDIARLSIKEMVKQTGAPVFDKDGLLLRGTVVRILLLPAQVAQAKLILKYLYDTYGDNIYISLMNQYTPIGQLSPPLNRRVSRDEYRQLVDYAVRLGVKNAYTQQSSAASDSFIPAFDGEGV